MASAGIPGGRSVVKKPDCTIRKESLTGCPACGSSSFSAEIESLDFESGTGTYRVECCRHCGLRFTNPRPDSNSLYSLYSNRDSPDYVRAQRIVDRLRAVAIRRWILRIAAHSGRCAPVLDYGCGDGFFSLQLARCDRFDRITAVDLHDQAPARLKGRAAIQYRSFAQLEKARDRYQLIFCRHVLEHMPDPTSVLAEFQTLLAPGGTLVVEVPNYESVWRQFFGKYYYGLYLPRHLLHFNENALRKLLDSYRQIELYHHHTPVLGRSLGYLLGVPLGNLGPLGIGLFPLQVLADRIAGSSSVLSLVLRKKNI